MAIGISIGDPWPYQWPYYPHTAPPMPPGVITYGNESLPGTMPLSEVDQLKAQVAALEARVAAMESKGKRKRRKRT